MSDNSVNSLLDSLAFLALLGGAGAGTPGFTFTGNKTKSPASDPIDKSLINVIDELEISAQVLEQNDRVIAHYQNEVKKAQNTRAANVKIQAERQQRLEDLVKQYNQKYPENQLNASLPPHILQRQHDFSFESRRHAEQQAAKAAKASQEFSQVFGKISQPTQPTQPTQQVLNNANQQRQQLNEELRGWRWGVEEEEQPDLQQNTHQDNGPVIQDNGPVLQTLY